MNWILNISAKFYGKLPLSQKNRTSLRLFIAKYAPGVFKAYTISNNLPLLNFEKTKFKPFKDPHSIASNINISVSEKPIVSVIIPTYGKVDYTLYCLISIEKYQPTTPFEIIVVDDCSPDDSPVILKKVQDIKFIANSTNLGFIRSCNLGAKEAKGEYLLFLNNDTMVTKGWMDELVRTFYELPGTGLVGSILVYPNGTLQEAGGIIWKDGSAWNFGRNQNPLLPVFNYAREVDYCSGASIMVPSSLFEELNGFDELYEPAFCEDSDLALKIRDRGYRVIYQPLSTVFHYEGVTSGTDTSTGIKSYQIVNQKKLFERWKDKLASHQENGVDVDAAKDRTTTKRVLVIDLLTPTPDKDAGSVTAINMILLLREAGFQVTFIPEDNFLYMPKYTTNLQRLGIEMLYAPYVTSVKQHLLVHGKRYDLVFIFRVFTVERNIQSIRQFAPQAKVIFHTQDLHHLRMSREAELFNDKIKQKEAEEMKMREFAAMRNSDASIVVSATELDLLNKELPNEKIYVFPLILDIRSTNKKFSERKDIVFVGGFLHPPNTDAVLHFVKDIMPTLRQTLPGITFYIVGSNPPPEITGLACEDIVVTGFVENLNELLDRMRVNVAPLRYGAGIKGKVGNAMAVGLPTVATPLAAEGMLLSNGKNIIVADTAEDFAAAITNLYHDETKWNELSLAGIEFAEQAWGGEAAMSNLKKILYDININHTPSKYPLRLYFK